VLEKPISPQALANYLVERLSDKPGEAKIA
jgi:hypothetical protein